MTALEIFEHGHGASIDSITLLLSDPIILLDLQLISTKRHEISFHIWLHAWLPSKVYLQGNDPSSSAQDKEEGKANPADHLIVINAGTL